MAKTHEHGVGEPVSVPQYDDGMIETMRIGGYVGVLPYRQYPDLSPADLRALNVGRRYLAERAGQAALAKAIKEGNASNPAAFLASYLAKWEAPTDGEFSTVAGRRAQIAHDFLAEKFGFTLGQISATDEARISATVPDAIAHPKHGAEIARRLAQFYATYVPPKKRETDGAAVNPAEVSKLSLDD